MLTSLHLPDLGENPTHVSTARGCQLSLVIAHPVCSSVSVLKQGLVMTDLSKASEMRFTKYAKMNGLSNPSDPPRYPHGYEAVHDGMADAKAEEDRRSALDREGERAEEKHEAGPITNDSSSNEKASYQVVDPLAGRADDKPVNEPASTV